MNELKYVTYKHLKKGQKISGAKTGNRNSRFSGYVKEINPAYVALEMWEHGGYEKRYSTDWMFGIELTDGEIRLSPGTMYGSLSKMEKDGLICFVREEEKRKIYRITELGSQVLALEMKRIERLYRNMMEVRGHEGS